MSEELKPCPFCGWHPMLYIGRVEFTDAEVECECGANVGNYPTENEAIEAWNKRVSDPSQSRLSEAVKLLEPFAEVNPETDQRKFLQLLICPEVDESVYDWAPRFKAVKAFLASLGVET